MKYSNELEHFLLDKEEELANAVIALGSASFRPKTIRKFIKLFNLETQFLGKGLVKVYFPERGFGFITDILKDNDIFFHRSKITNPEAISRLRRRVLVEYTAEKSPKYLERMTVTSLTILE
jgi:cold shock CspA family protein